MKLSILTEANKRTGFGHVIRCCSIYEEFLQNNIPVELFIDTEDEIKLFNDIHYKKLNWLSDLFDIESDIILVDSYSLSKKNWDNLEKKSKMLIYINDDNVDIYSKNITSLRFAIEAKNFHNKKQLFGIKYFPIRKNLQNISQIKSNNILVMFGGTDIRELSIKLLPLYKKYPNFNFNIITANETIFEKIPKQDNIITFLNPNWNELAKLMANAYIAISSGGTILYELAYLSIPTIAISVIDNQEKGIAEFVKKGFIDRYLHYKNKNLLDEIDLSLINFIQNYKFYHKKAQIGKKLIDGYGSSRIVQDILKLYKSEKL